MPEPPSEEQLQFDKAQFAEGNKPASSCAACKQPLAGCYYEAAGQAFCPACKEQIEASMRGGSPFGRFLRATVFGSVAAVVGALLFFGVSALTGYILALISILIGYLVGVAVRRGAHARGGLLYQLLAVFLTLTSIACSYGLLAVHLYAKEEKNPTASVQAQAFSRETTSATLASALPTSATLAATAEEPEGKEADISTSASAESAAIGALAGKDGEPPALPRPVLILIAAGLFVVLSFGVLFAQAAESFLTILIIGFGLWEAWKTNRRVKVEFLGPLSVGVPGEPAAHSGTPS